MFIDCVLYGCVICDLWALRLRSRCLIQNIELCPVLSRTTLPVSIPHSCILHTTIYMCVDVQYQYSSIHVHCTYYVPCVHVFGTLTELVAVSGLKLLTLQSWGICCAVHGLKWQSIHGLKCYLYWLLVPKVVGSGSGHPGVHVHWVWIACCPHFVWASYENSSVTWEVKGVLLPQSQANKHCIHQCNQDCYIWLQGGSHM